MAWSRILRTDLAKKAFAIYEGNPDRHYHNWQHVLNLYWAAEHIYGFAYDEDLDRAILGHDVIYDDKPEKELRSAEWLRSNCDSEGVERSCTHIMRTANPSVTDDNRMILLDYARLRTKEFVLPDRELFLRETQKLTGACETAFATGNLAYFRSLRPNFDDENLASLPDWEKQAFREIREGMDFTIAHSEQLLSSAA